MTEPEEKEDEIEEVEEETQLEDWEDGDIEVYEGRDRITKDEDEGWLH